MIPFYHVIYRPLLLARTVQTQGYVALVLMKFTLSLNHLTAFKTESVLPVARKTSQRVFVTIS